MGLSDEEVSQIYQALGNPHRRKIIQLLGSRGPMSFSELRQSLNISIGALYHNLGQLGPLISQLSDKRYALTERGSAVYSLMKRELDLLEDSSSIATHPPWARGLLSLAHRLFFPKGLLSSLYAHPGPRLKVAASLVLALGALLCSLTHTDVILTYVRPGRGVFAIPELGLYFRTEPALLSALTFIATWLTLSILPYAVVSVLKWSWDWRGMARFMEGSAVSMLPAAVYVLIHNAVLRAGAAGYATYAALGGVFALLWAVMIGSIAASLSIAKRVSSVKALVVMVAVAYLCLASQQGLIVKWLFKP
ncbi:MAG: helix-turn-helix domain-containing protein [Candidatus Nezhaarchaeota archaeon]|nr:helix-turn-helix domain-containing protein [Candidatus Nezhaarchaeota archaeon]